MKKIFLLWMALVSALTMQADDYAYLTFETTDGAKASVEVSSLTLTINGAAYTNATVNGGSSVTLSSYTGGNGGPGGPGGTGGGGWW